MKITHSILTALSLATALHGLSGKSSAFAIDIDVEGYNSSAFLPSVRLLHADVYESIYVGVGGDRSRLAEELFSIVAKPGPEAKVILQDLYTQGTPIARIYALIGSMLIADSASTKTYYAELMNLGETEIRALDGCDYYTTSISEIILELRRPASRLSFREAYQEWQAEQKARGAIPN